MRQSTITETMIDRPFNRIRSVCEGRAERSFVGPTSFCTGTLRGVRTAQRCNLEGTPRLRRKPPFVPLVHSLKESHAHQGGGYVPITPPTCTSIINPPTMSFPRGSHALHDPSLSCLPAWCSFIDHRGNAQRSGAL